jgi:polyisoprenoid-binding protein YceI
MKKALFISAILASLAFAAPYGVDVSHTNVGFKVKHMMISSTNGKFKSFSGTFDYDEATKSVSNIKGKIAVASIDTDDAKRDAHLKDKDFFDAAGYPDITFVSKSVKGNKATGDLTIKGVTKPVTLTYEFGGATTDPWGNKRAGFSLSGTIDRRDFGIVWNKALDMGGVAVSNEVKLSVDIEGIAEKK